MAIRGTKLYRFDVAVEGSGDFPIDMLRYDSSYPLTSVDASRVDNSQRQEKRTVNVRMVSVNPNGPTVERWRSFGWQVLSWKPVEY